MILQPVHQPIPGEGVFKGNGGDALFAGREPLQESSHVARQSLVNEAAIRLAFERSDMLKSLDPSACSARAYRYECGDTVLMPSASQR